MIAGNHDDEPQSGSLTNHCARDLRGQTLGVYAFIHFARLIARSQPTTSCTKSSGPAWLAVVQNRSAVLGLAVCAPGRWMSPAAP